MDVFPNFTQLNLQSREAYERVAHQFPPYSDLSFSTLMTWWNFEDDLKVAAIFSGFVIDYRLPYSDEDSGLCVVGMNNVDKAIKNVFAYQRQKGIRQRLVHVPEFTVEAIVDNSVLHIAEELSYNEYIVPVSRLYPVESVRSDERRKLKKFLEIVGEGVCTTKSLDLGDMRNRDILLSSAYTWWQNSDKTNDARGDEQKAMKRNFSMASELGTRNICLFLNNELVGFVTYHVSHDNQYFIGSHIKAKKIPHIFDYLEHLVAHAAYDEGVEYLNVEMDLGIQGLRNHKLGLKPVEFLRKYTVTSIIAS